MAVEEELLDAGVALRELLNPHVDEDVKLVQKGMMLFRQGMVSQLKFDGGVSATVQDVVPVKVELDLVFWSMSECSCPGDELCRHKLAVFFAAYSKVGSVSDWLEEWREPVRNVKEFSRWGMQRAKDLVKANGVLKPDYSRWVQSMDVSFDQILRAKKYSNPYVMVELFQIYERRLRAGMPVEQEWRLLYELIANVVSFKKLALLSEEMGHTEEVVKRTYVHLFHQMVDDAEELTMRIGMQSLPFDFDVFVDRFTEDSFDLLTCVQGLAYERTYLYRLLWSQFFKKRALREAEFERISTQLKALSEEENPLPLMIGGIHLSFLLGEDERALGWIGRFEDQVIVPYLLYWMDYLSQLKAWKRVGAVIELFLGKVRVYLEALDSYQARSSFTRLALKAISSYCEEDGHADLYERALMQMLPYSFYDYEYVLFSRGQYDKWGELYSFIGIPFSDLPKERIKLVEKEQPEVLVALLHQSVQREIDLKNRSSYKVAVRHLKKLRTLYKKMKRVDDWQFFLDSLLEKTKRLRAFQEECQRSKLVEG